MKQSASPGTFKGTALHVASVFLLTVILAGVFAPLDFMDFEHEAVLFKPAIDLVEGKMLFRDSFTQYGAVPVLMQAAAISVFGKYMLAAKLQVALLSGFTGVFLWLIWRRICAPWLATLSVVIWNLLCYRLLVVFLAWSSDYALCFQVISIYCLLKFLEKNGGHWLLLSGFLACLTFLSKQNVGVYLAFALGACLLAYCWNQRRPLAATAAAVANLAGGFVLGLALFAGWLVKHQAFHDWWLDSIVWPQAWARLNAEGPKLKYFFSSLTAFHAFGIKDKYSVGDTRPDLLFVWMPVVCLVVAWNLALRIKDRRVTERGFLLAVLSLVSLASWLQYYPVPGIGHVWWSSSPMIGIILFLLWEAAHAVASRLPVRSVWKNRGRHGGRESRRRNVPAVLFGLMVVLLFLPAMGRRLIHAAQTIAVSRVMVRTDNPFRGMLLIPEQAVLVTHIGETIDREINAKSARPRVILDGTEGLYLAFVHNAQNFHPMWPTRYTPVVNTIYPDFPEKLSAYIEQESPFVMTNSAFISEFMRLHPSYKIADKVSDGLILLQPGNVSHATR